MQNLAIANSSQHCSKQKNPCAELLDVEHHNIHTNLTQRMRKLSFSVAPDMSRCRKLAEYTPLFSYTDYMWHEVSRLEKYVGNKFVLGPFGCRRKWFAEEMADWFLYLLRTLAINSEPLSQQCSCQLVFSENFQRKQSQRAYSTSQMQKRMLEEW